MEVSADFATGDFHQDGTGIPSDYAIIQLNAGPRWNLGVNDVFHIDLLAGFSYNRIDIDYVDLGGIDMDRDEATFGPMMGLELAWMPIDRLAVYGRATYALGIAETTNGEAEAGLRVRVYRGLHLFGGYRHWRFRYDVSAGDIDLKMNGVLFGAEMRFAP